MRRPSAGRRDGARLTRAAAGTSLAKQFAALFADGGTTLTRDLRFEAWRYTATGPNVASFDDAVTGGAVKLTVTGTVAAPTANATMAGALTARFNAGPYATLNLSTAEVQFLSDDTDATAVVVWNPKSVTGVKYLYSTTDSGVMPGVTHYVNGTNIRAAQYKTGGAVIADSLAGTGVAIDTPMYTQISKSASAYARRQKSTTITSGVPSAPVSESAKYAFILGSLAGGGSAGDFDFGALYMFRRVLTAEERTLLQAYIQATWGIAP